MWPLTTLKLYLMERGMLMYCHCVMCEKGILDRHDAFYVEIGGATWSATVGPVCAACRDGLNKHSIKKELLIEKVK